MVQLHLVKIFQEEEKVSWAHWGWPTPGPKATNGGGGEEEESVLLRRCIIVHHGIAPQRSRYTIFVRGF